jgi:hypothetical protein
MPVIDDADSPPAIVSARQDGAHQAQLRPLSLAAPVKPGHDGGSRHQAPVSMSGRQA